MDVVLLARAQFALTVMFHFLFPPITIGLALLITIIETLRSANANLGVSSGAEAVEAAAEPLEARGIIVAERGRFRVRDRNVLRYYARTLDHLLTSPDGKTH